MLSKRSSSAAARDQVTSKHRSQQFVALRKVLDSHALFEYLLCPRSPRVFGQPQKISDAPLPYNFVAHLIDAEGDERHSRKGEHIPLGDAYLHIRAFSWLVKSRKRVRSLLA